MNNTEFFVDWDVTYYEVSTGTITSKKSGSFTPIEDKLMSHIGSTTVPFGGSHMQLFNGAALISKYTPNVLDSLAVVSADGGSILVSQVHRLIGTISAPITDIFLAFHVTYDSLDEMQLSTTIPDPHQTVTDAVNITITLTAVLPYTDQDGNFPIADGTDLSDASVAVLPSALGVFGDYFNFTTAKTYSAIGGIGLHEQPFITPSTATVRNLYNITTGPNERRIQMVCARGTEVQTIAGAEFAGYKYAFDPIITQPINKSFNLKFHQMLGLGVTKPLVPLYPVRIGQWFQGGWYVGTVTYPDSKQYLLVMNDYKVTSSAMNSVNSANSAWDGFSNTTSLGTNIPYATAHKMVRHGYSDWYIPAIEELRVIVANLHSTNNANLPPPLRYGSGDSGLHTLASTIWSSTKMTTSEIAYIVASSALGGDGLPLISSGSYNSATRACITIRRILIA